MNQERLLKVLLRPQLSEKATTVVANHNFYAFEVTTDATKYEIRKAVETIFKVDVVSVNTVRVKGKHKRTARGLTKKSKWKKAYVKLEAGQEIDFLDAE